MDNLFLTILNMSLTGSFVILAICLGRIPLKKAPKIISYWLWLVAGFRLVFPFSIESTFSLIPFKAQTIPQDIGMQTLPSIDSGIAAVNDTVRRILPAGEPTASVNPLQIWIRVGASLWLLGVAVMVIYALVTYFLLKRKMRPGVHIEANIYEAADIPSPFVLGVLRPKIYLPEGLTGQERQYILLHEKTHIQRGDHIIKFIAYFILCLHWFNPLVWLAFRLMGEDMEMSCDEKVLKEMGDDMKKEYSLSLLSLATEGLTMGGSPLAYGEGAVKGRIKNVLKFKKPSRWIIVLSITLVVALGIGLTLNRSTGGSFLRSLLPMTMNSVVREPHFSGTVTEVYDGGILVHLNEGEDARRSSDLITVSTNVKLKDSMTDFLPGDRVTVYYNGEIAESYPARVNTVYAIMLTSPDLRVFMDDLYQLSTLRTPEVGSNSAVERIIGELPRIHRDYALEFFSTGDDYATGSAPYTLTLYYGPNDVGSEEIGDIHEITVSARTSALLFALVDDLDEITYAFRADPSGGELDKEAYLARARHGKEEITEYLNTLDLEWEDFHSDWNGTMDKIHRDGSPFF